VAVGEWRNGVGEKRCVLLADWPLALCAWVWHSCLGSVQPGGSEEVISYRWRRRPVGHVTQEDDPPGSSSCITCGRA